MKANRVHHIIEILEDEALAYNNDNLISLEEYKHTYIHKLYRNDKERIQNLLKLMRKTYLSGDLEIGKYKSLAYPPPSQKYIGNCATPQ